MKILVVGSGGREHAIVEALAQSPEVRKIYAAPGNGGIREQAELVSIEPDNIEAIADFATAERIDLTFIGPEMPLSKGIVDAFRNRFEFEKFCIYEYDKEHDRLELKDESGAERATGTPVCRSRR